MIDLAVRGVPATQDNITLAAEFMDDSLGQLLGRSRAIVVKTLDASVADMGITHAQGNLLLGLASGRCTTAAELSRELSVDAAAMTRMIDRLEKRNLLLRMPRGVDRRIIRVQLTEEGSRLAERLPSIYAQASARVFSEFRAEEVEQLRSLLQKFLTSTAGRCGASVR